MGTCNGHRCRLPTDAKHTSTQYVHHPNHTHHTTPDNTATLRNRWDVQDTSRTRAYWKLNYGLDVWGMHEVSIVYQIVCPTQDAMHIHQAMIHAAHTCRRHVGHGDAFDNDVFLASGAQPDTDISRLLRIKA